MRLIEELARAYEPKTWDRSPSMQEEMRKDMKVVVAHLVKRGLLTSQAIDRLIEDGDWPLKEE